MKIIRVKNTFLAEMRVIRYRNFIFTKISHMRHCFNSDIEDFFVSKCACIVIVMRHCFNRYIQDSYYRKGIFEIELYFLRRSGSVS